MTSIPPAPFYCPVCGRDDGQHDPTPEERRWIRRVKWRAFWRGFASVFVIRRKP